MCKSVDWRVVVVYNVLVLKWNFRKSLSIVWLGVVGDGGFWSLN